MDVKSLYNVFPDYPNIKSDSETDELSLITICPNLTKEERDEIIDELLGIKIVEKWRNNTYRITNNGWKTWQKTVTSE